MLTADSLHWGGRDRFITNGNVRKIVTWKRGSAGTATVQDPSRR